MNYDQLYASLYFEHWLADGLPIFAFSSYMAAIGRPSPIGAGMLEKFGAKRIQGRR